MHTPEDSLVFGGNFLPGMATVDVQLAVFELERRSQVQEKYRFPYFVPAMFFGLAHAGDPAKLSARERRGLDDLLEACDAWAANGCHLVPEKQRHMVTHRNRADSSPTRPRRASGRSRRIHL